MTKYRATFSGGKVLTRTSPREYTWAWATKYWLELPEGAHVAYSSVYGFSKTKALAMKAVSGKEGAEIAPAEREG